MEEHVMNTRLSVGLLIPAIVLAVSVNASTTPLTLAAPREIQGTLWPAGTEVTLNDKGELARCCLVRELTTPSGFKLPAGTEIWSFSQGQPWACCLHGDSHFCGVALPKHSTVFLSPVPMGWRLWPSKDVTIQGHVCHQIDDGSGHVFYRDGKLRAIWVLGVEEIDGVPCTSDARGMPMGVSLYGSDCMAWFYENGHLQQGMLAQDETIQGHTLKKGDIVSLKPEGGIDLSAKPLGRTAMFQNEGGNLAEIMAVLQTRNKSHAAACEVEVAPLLEGMRAIERLKNVGQATPLDAIETLNWAAWHADIGTHAGMIVFDGSGESAAKALFASLSPGMTAQLQSPERLMAILIEYGYPTGRGYRVIGEHGIFFAADVRIVRCEIETSRGRHSYVTYRMRRVGGKWMLEVNEWNVSGLSDLLTVNGGLPPPADH